MEATHLAKSQAVWSWEVETHRLVIHHLTDRLLGEIEPGSRGMGSYPALHLIKILFDIVGSERLTVLETYPGTHLHFECPIIEPACIGCQRMNHPPILIHADRLLHGIPGNK